MTDRHTAAGGLCRRELAITLGASLGLGALPAWAASRAQLERDASAALARLTASSPKARELAQRARAVLTFPRIVKAGFVIGAQTGDGVLKSAGRTLGYYNLSAGSFGLQAGAQAFSLAMFFISRSALDYLDRSDGWSLGAGPTVAVIDKGAAADLNTTQLTQAVYAMPFGQKGLMAGLSLEGSKITRIHPD